MKEFVKKIPIFGDIARGIYYKLKIKEGKLKPFLSSQKYWKDRYDTGGDSGSGSYGKFSQFKAETINNFVLEHAIQSVIEFGCGDGNQLKLMNYLNYIGFDISPSAIDLCKESFMTDQNKTFRLLDEYSGEKADLTISLDVIYHLVEDEVFRNHMKILFGASERYVIIYSSNSDKNRGYSGTHVRHRKFTNWIKDNCQDWELIKHVPNRHPFKGDHRQGSFADFFIYAIKNPSESKSG